MQRSHTYTVEGYTVLFTLHRTFKKIEDEDRKDVHFLEQGFRDRHTVEHYKEYVCSIKVSNYINDGKNLSSDKRTWLHS